MKKLLLALVFWITAVGLAFGAVNINTATKEQLDALKGIGPTKAQAIIDYRTKHGPFKSIDDLEKVPGIGPATLKDIRNDITLTGATTPAKGADKAAAKKDDAKGAARADEKAAKKSDEKKKAADKPAAKKDDVKAGAKAEDKAVKKEAAKSATTDTKEKGEKK